MKTNRNVLKAVAAAVLATTTGMATALDTTVVVSASVSSVCTVGATQAAFTNIAINPSTIAADATMTGNIVYKCTKNTTPTVSVTNGGTVLDGGAAGTLPYAFTLGTPDAGTGFSAAAAVAKVVGTATIGLADAQDAAAGSYSDTVTVSITF